MKLFFFDIPKNSFTVYIIGKTEIIKENVKGQHFMNERIANLVKEVRSREIFPDFTKIEYDGSRWNPAELLRVWFSGFSANMINPAETLQNNVIA